MKILDLSNFFYTSSRKLVVFSIVLIVASLLFAGILFADPVLLLTYYITVVIITSLTSIIKISLYSRKRNVEDGEETSTQMWPLVVILIVGMFAPFLFLIVLEAVYIIVLIDAYVAGVNLPEVILYFYARKKGRLSNRQE